MILRLILMLVVFLGAPALCLGLVVRHARARLRALSQARQQGQLNTELSCADCLGAVDPNSRDTIYAADTFRHRRCYQKLLQ